MATVRDLLIALREYNPDADCAVYVDGAPRAFCLAYGSHEGVTMATADVVRIVPADSTIGYATDKPQ